LDALREQPSLLASQASVASAASDEKQDILQAWQRLCAPDLHEIGDFLALDERLLLIFPLTIQNELLGALVVEENDPQQLDMSRVSVSSNRHLREKRLEIATGISQQAALAIQNERFQRNLVERERMDRELQLAHDIQRSLLPPALPNLPGWELGVLWKTAREVGGDFYDLFELPGGDLGLAIADVADKGLPAALYMTHVHALLRAMAQMTRPPAEVLARINDAIAGEGTLGMFVTLVYGVLSPQTGRLVYANAGHNPPILLRAGSAQAVGRIGGGMALGVERGQQVEQAELTLQAGEALVLFTDGVTEAFSPQGQMFGQEQLVQAIDRRTPGDTAAPVYYSAQGIVNAIEDKLTEFRGDQPPEDDLTLLVIARLPTDRR
jgi:phosphoserine phosphatase RsbU/P